MHTRRIASRLCALLSVAAISACGMSAGRSNGGDPSPGGGWNDLALASPSDDGGIAEQDIGSIDPGGPQDPNCHEESFAPKKVGDPDIILLQDVSGSMADGNPSKYSQVTNALGDVLTGLQMQNSPIEWGLYFFPSDGDCGVAVNPDVPVAKNNAADIAMAIQAKSPNGNTPTHVAVNNATAYFTKLKDARGHYLLLATDGEPNCSGGNALPMACMNNMQCPKGQTCMMVPFFGGICADNGNEAIAAITAARMAGVKTFVVGIDTGGDSSTLNQMAVEGGTARAGNTKYYAVTDQATLEMTLKNITSQIISCSFALMSLPTQGQSVVVQIGAQMINQDTMHTNGWDLDPMSKTLTFYGPACTALQANPGVVSVGYTCPPPS